MLAQTDAEVADVLDRIGELLEAQADVHRAHAFRRAADAIRGHRGSVVDLYRERGLEGLDALPYIGKGIASVIAESLETGHCRLLQRLSGEVTSEDLFATVPGIGSTLAHHVVSMLHIDSLEELEVAAHDGRLQRVRGFGPRRVRAVRDQLAARLAHERTPRHRAAREPFPPPDVATILAVDEDYRVRAHRGELRTIAPRRFNPSGVAWLPILHAERNGWAFTALFSNSARAHALGRTRDWVVIFYDKDGRSGQCTVVTEPTGAQAGLRVIRGRENECAAAHAAARGRISYPPCPRCGNALEPPSWKPAASPAEEEMVCSFCHRPTPLSAPLAHGPVPRFGVS
jgi:hypothetical protein